MKLKKIPQRMCIGCQEMKNKKEMTRIVRTPEGEIVFDTTGKKSGRGAYLCASDPCLAKAVKEKRLEKALRCAVPADIYEQLRSELVK